MPAQTPPWYFDLMVCTTFAPHTARTHLVEVEDQVQLTYVVEVVVQYLNKKVDRLKVGKLVVCDVAAKAEVKARIPSV